MNPVPETSARFVSILPGGARGLRLTCRLLGAAMAISALLAALATQAALTGHTRETTPAYFEDSIKPLFTQYCLKCHSREKHKGDINLEQFTTLDETQKQPKIWLDVAEQLGLGQMPPEEKPQPSAPERERLLKWIDSELTEIAQEHAGDAGPVVLRRLSNAEYTYTLRDLTGLEALDPAREFPVDGAAGEGFVNTGNALVMSPSLLDKYLQAGKEIASHVVLLPDGIRFSPKTTRRDWVDEILLQLKEFYGGYADADGKLPLSKYLTACLESSQSLQSGETSIKAVAQTRGLNEKYLDELWRALSGNNPSIVFDAIRPDWRQTKRPKAETILAEIGRWQGALSKFQNVGHMKPWLVNLDPVATEQEVRIPINPPEEATEMTVYLSSQPVGAPDVHVIWQNPRLVSPGRPDLPLKEIRRAVRDLTERRQRYFASAEQCLAAASEAEGSTNQPDAAMLARRHGVDADAVAAWVHYLGIDADNSRPPATFFTAKMTKVGGFDFVNGWGSSDTPLMVANSSGEAVRIPGNMKAHSVAVHPSPTLRAAVGWKSPINGMVKIDGRVARAHPECGAGVTWALELDRGASRQRLGGGALGGADDRKIDPIGPIPIRMGDRISILVGPRDGHHECGLTAVDLNIRETQENGREWSLAEDVSPDALAGNPHSDRFGETGVWEFYTEPEKNDRPGLVIPPGSILGRWQLTGDPKERGSLAHELQNLLANPALAAKGSPDESLYRQLASLRGPLFDLTMPGNGEARALASQTVDGDGATGWGLDDAAFGQRTNGKEKDAASLYLTAPSVIAVRLPVDLAKGCELRATGRIDALASPNGVAQLQILAARTNEPRQLTADAPILAAEGTARQKVLASFADFRRLFPAALCYSRIVPVDEPITLELFHRDDEPLQHLMLDDAGKARLDHLWNELRFLSRSQLTVVDAFGQLMEYATQDSDPRLFEPLRKPIMEGAAAFRKLLVDTEPRHLEALLDFTERAWRRPLTGAEKTALRELYQTLRGEDIPHEDAFRLTMARVLVAPSFLYKLEQPGAGTTQGPVSDREMASRLSYFIWSSAPDATLMAAAAAGKLHQPDQVAAQASRMLSDTRVRRLATEFGCQWLHIHDFDQLDEKSERTFPTFNALRGDMYEESILFFTDLFQHDRSILNILEADYTYLNESLAHHYGIPGVTGANWRRVDGVRSYGRGGILALASTLAKQSGASRTSPILRGNWICEALLGEKLPKPPKEVPKLPEDESSTNGMTIRQMVEKHSTDPKCARCHSRMDYYGFSLEEYDAIGRRRQSDAGGRPIETQVRALDGNQFQGIDGLRSYLVTVKRDVLLKQFCRKLLGYSLGRATLLSDEPLLNEMVANLKQKEYHVSAVVESIVRSRQFREIRGVETAYDN